jgi:hypothetical protein
MNTKLNELLESQKEALIKNGWSYGTNEGVDFAINKDRKEEIYGKSVFMFLEEEAEELISGNYRNYPNLNDLLFNLDENYKLKSLNPLEIFYDSKKIIKGESAFFILKEAINTL